MRNIIYNIIQGFKNIYFFRNVIWNYRWWDYEYNLKIFIKSLEITKEGMKTSDIRNNKKSIKEITKVISLLDPNIKYRNINPQYDIILSNWKYGVLLNKEMKKLLEMEEEFDKGRWEQGWKLVSKNMKNW